MFGLKSYWTGTDGTDAQSRVIDKARRTLRKGLILMISRPDLSPALPQQRRDTTELLSNVHVLEWADSLLTRSEPSVADKGPTRQRTPDASSLSPRRIQVKGTS